MTAENIHDRFPEFSKEMADRYAVHCQQRADQAIKAGKMKDMIVPLEVELADGSRITADTDQQPRPQTTMEGLAELKAPFRDNGRVTAGNASGLNDGAAVVLLMSEDKGQGLGAAAQNALDLLGSGGGRPHHHGHRAGACHRESLGQGRLDHG